MKLTKMFFVLCLVLNITLFAQTKSELKVVDESGVQKGGHPIDVAPFLEKYYKKNGIDPTQKLSQSLFRSTAWNFQVGDKKSFKVIDYVGLTTYSTDFTCRAVGVNCYIFVEDSLWTDQHNRVNQNAVDSVKIAFDSKTPANKNKGIFQTDTEIFGNPPNVDNDPRIIILIHNIKDGKTRQTGWVAGYFSSGDETGANGNAPAEIYHLDANPTDLRDNGDLQEALSTTAHEFQHMIHYNYISTATAFMNEGFSLTAEVMNGYSIYNQSLYASETNHYLLDWRNISDANVGNDYSRAARFFLYIYEQFGAQFFTKYLSNKVDGINATNTVFTQLGSSRRFIDVTQDWMVANIVNNKNVKSVWGYNYQNLKTVGSRTHINPNVTYTDNITNLGAQYITFNNGKNLSIKFTDPQSIVTVKAIKIGSGLPVVDDVTLGTTYNVPDFGTTYSKVIFAVYFVSPISLSFPGTQTASCTYTATGTAVTTTKALAYDTTEPTNAFGSSVGDTMAVYFDGVIGARIDSIKVALRQAGSLNGNIWKYTGVARPTPLGTKLTSSQITATSNITTRPPSPYPVPWPNWVKVDVKSSNIDATNSFVVGFVASDAYKSDGTGGNTIMLSSIAGTDPYHTYVYLSNPGSGSSPNWYYLGGTSTIQLLLIRAYVTIGATGIEGPVEILPSAFKLEQNYPNPFNPSTIISYNLPKQSNVQIKIYDAVGNEIRSLINEDKAAGKYNILWDSRDNSGNRVASGVYFYKITAGDFVQTKKMVLIK